MKNYRVKLLKDGSVYFSASYDNKDNTTSGKSVKLDSLSCIEGEGSDNLTEEATQEIKNLIKESVDA